jgi:Tfp pilus assembly protein PilX
MQTENPQRGAAMFTALILLIALTLVALASLGTSLLELRMSGNEEMAMSAFQSAEAGAEVIINDASLPDEEVKFLKARPGTGPTTCYRTNTKYGWPSTCTYTVEASEVPPPVNSEDYHIKVTQTIDSGPPPPSGRYGTSSKHFSAASLEAESIYDRASTGQGKSVVVQGFIRLLPGGGVPPGGPPTGAGIPRDN